MASDAVERIRKAYPVGCRIELIKMNDQWTNLVEGDLGTCDGVDEIGNVMMTWDRGSSLSLVPGEDQFRLISRKCPVCGSQYSGYPAISRTDNVTEICPTCGTREALQAAGISEDKQAEIIRAIEEGGRNNDN